MLPGSIKIEYGKDYDIISQHEKILSIYESTGTTGSYSHEIRDIIDRFSNEMDLIRSFTVNKSINDLLPTVDEFIKIAKTYIRVEVLESKCSCTGKCKCGTYTRTKNDYEDEENYIKGLKRFCGKLSTKIDFKQLTKDLDVYFHGYGYPVSEEIKNMELNIDLRTRGKTNIVMMRDALAYINQSKLNDDINLVCSEYWGWALPNLDDYMEQLIIDYRKTQNVYKVMARDRKSCLNLQYRIYKHLQLVGYPVNSGDFRIPTTDEISKNHDILWRQMCKGCGLEYKPTL
jgi:hypothetical protein